MGALHAAHERGLAIPDDLSISGFDDIPVAPYSIPSLTTVRMPVREMVDRAMSMVLDEGGLDVREPPSVLQPSLVVRSSTGPAPEHGN
jgi:DNA-binding LacI/PurR family transcriptional regulator